VKQPNGDLQAAFAGQAIHVVRVSDDGTTTCNVEGSDPVAARLSASGRRIDGSKGMPLVEAKAAATFQVINLDSAGEGLNDPTPATPINGNAGTTVGEQRRIAIAYAAQIWSRALQSSVAIRIGAKFDPLGCNTLGSAGPTNGHVFSSAPPPRAVLNHWYVIANAEALAGIALNATDANDIVMTFNSDFGTPTCPGTPANYLGLAPTASQVAFVPTVIHEIAHGLGFSPTPTCTTPAGCGGGSAAGDHLNGIPSIYEFWAFDVALNKYWDQMSSLERALSSRNDPFLTWDGPFVKASTSTVLPGGQGVTNGRVRMYAPLTFESGSSVGHFHEEASPNLMMEPRYDSDVFAETDLTPWFLVDIGWTPRSRYRLTVTIAGQGGVGSNPPGIWCPNDCNDLYGDADVVTLTSGAFPGWQFAGWTGACTGPATTCQVTLSQTRNVTANFTQIPASGDGIFADGFEP
jgi:uncharacterized repeat protein (TIGR02543 family)